MLYQFSGTGKVFNGRFWRTYDVRVKATAFPIAIRRATTKTVMAYREDVGKRSKIEQLTISLERLGQVIVNEIPPLETE